MADRKGKMNGKGLKTKGYGENSWSLMLSLGGDKGAYI
jgi:hypothetical protein